MKINIETVDHLATLSALEFNQEEKEKLVGDLNGILDMVNQIQEAQTADEDVYNHSHKLSDLREDIAQESAPQELMLENAPKKRRGCFNVPLVVE